MDITKLPPNVTTNIFSYLDQRQLAFTVRRTCKSWYHLSYERLLWRSIDTVHGVIKDANSLISILQTVGNLIESLFLNLQTLDNEGILQTGEICPNLKELVFYGPREIQFPVIENSKKSFCARHFDFSPELKIVLPTLSERFQSLQSLSVQVDDVSCLNSLFPALEKISLYEGVVTSAFEAFVENHPSLRCIKFRDCSISGDCVSMIMVLLQSLELIEISKSVEDTQRDNEELDIENMSSNFWVAANSLKKDDFLVNEKLKHVTLNRSLCSDYFLECLVKQSPNLETLAVIGCFKITSHCIDDIAKYMPSLKSLQVNDQEYNRTNCIIANSCLQSIAANCTSLRIFQANFANSELSDTGIQAMSESCPYLEEVEIKGCTSLTDAAVLSLVENCHMIRKLNLGNCVSLTGSSLVAVLSKCKNIRYLNMETCHRVTGIKLDIDKLNEELNETQGATDTLKHNSKEIESLTDGFNDKLKLRETDEEINNLKYKEETKEIEGVVDQIKLEDKLQIGSKEESLVTKTKVQEHDNYITLKALENHSHLRTLNLSFCSTITNQCLKEISEYCRDLRSIDVQGCSQVTNPGVQHLVTKCVFLESLNISGGSMLRTSMITDQCFTTIAAHGDCLKELIILKNRNISHRGVCEVLEGCSKLSLVKMTSKYDETLANIAPFKSVNKKVELRWIDDKKLEIHVQNSQIDY